MEEFTDRQKWFIQNLAEKLGFSRGSFLNSYLKHINSTLLKHSNLIKKYSINSRKPNVQPSFNSILIVNPKPFNLIDLLLLEYELKKDRQYQQKNFTTDTISATDISNFTFCPISYAISKSFEIEKSEDTVMGTSLHEKKGLIKYLRPTKAFKYDFDWLDEKNVTVIESETIFSFKGYITDNNASFFNEIANSEVSFYGHDLENLKKYFKSAKGNFIGQPDYIFKSNIDNTFYVVEEKFKFVPKHNSDYNPYIDYGYEPEKKTFKTGHDYGFYINHVNQLRSYLFGINEYDLRYGFLIYWKYNLEKGQPVIISCSVMKIEKTAYEREQLLEVYNKLRNVITNKGGSFDVEARHPSKCARCSYNIICGHKTGKFSEFKLPYPDEYLKVK